GAVLRGSLPRRGWLAWSPMFPSLLLALLLTYVSVPFVVYLFPAVLTKFVFLNFLSFPFFADLRRPELLLNNTISLYLATEPGVTVGIWHTVPGSRGAEAQGKDQPSHRVQFLKTMGAADFHILALDYRGYGDSSGLPTESGFTTGVQVDAVVLESPYTNIRDAAAHIPLTKIYRQFPGFEYLILDSLAQGDMFFRSDE
ncbi:PREDICTED: monoacylglycerol lipase ABHD12-like, partial [Pterocles gutturalis]|uniref:monoacylglycerol lipase ABHD12-like n=1 Tax=Pterocles gutturalis TaxID=240206 RepID=UPI000528948E